MTTNTPTPAPDLDARVAALMHIIDSNVSNLGFAEFEQLEQAIRAELQNPALHDPVTEEKLLGLASKMLSYWRMVERNDEPAGAAMQASNDFTRALHIALQGRAQPAQEEITAALTVDQIDAVLVEADELFQAGAYGDIKRHVKAVGTLRKHLQSIRASKGEKT